MPDSPGGNTVASFRFWRDGEPHTVARAVIPPHHSAADLGTNDPVAIERALLRFAVGRLETLADAGEVPEEYTMGVAVVEVLDEDLAEFRRLTRVKECRYQLRDDGASDLFCSAAGPNDETVIGSIGVRRLAPTSQPICEVCALPSTDFICSHLTHPQVIGIQAMAGPVRRVPGRAMCEQGEPGVEQAIDRCRPGGHACWERHIATALEAKVAELPPLSLPEAVDFLDAIWRLRFGDRLLRRLPTSTVAGLALPVASRDDFKARMSDVSAVFEGFEIGDHLLGAEPGRVTGSLNRLERALREVGIELPAAIAQLRAVLRVRTALQHPDRARELHQHFDAMGIQFPPTDWASAWAAVTSTLVQSIAGIRDDIRAGSV